MFSFDLENEFLGLPEDEAEEVEDKDGEGNEKKDDEKDEKKKKVRVVPRKPLPKLDTIRLCGAEGISKLPGRFRNFRSRGEGFELQEMDDVLQKIELWAHRLFPKLTFDDFLGRCEKLGSKREIQTALRKMRMGEMPVDEPQQTDDVARGDGDRAEGVDEFDEVMKEYEATFGSAPSPVPRPPPPVAAQSVLTQEQRERIEKNRKLAEERKRQSLVASLSTQL